MNGGGCRTENGRKRVEKKIDIGAREKIRVHLHSEKFVGIKKCLLTHEFLSVFKTECLNFSPVLRRLVIRNCAIDI